MRDRKTPAGMLLMAVAAAFSFSTRLMAANTRVELLRRLESDVGRAVSNATLSEAPAKKLTQARQTISESISSRRTNDRYERNLLQSAVKDIQSVFKNKKAFRPDDRQVVLDDLDRIKKAGILASPPARRAPPRSPRPAPLPRYPRRLLLSGAPSVW